MKPTKSNHTVLTLALLALAFSLPPSALVFAAPLGTAFTYQGKLTDGANPANGIYDFNLSLHTNASDGVTVAGPLTNSAIAVSNGLFTLALDFGSGAFDGGDRWLRIHVRTNGNDAFITLSPAQQITPAPYALYALNAGGGGSSPWQTNGANVYFNTGNVGIGTANPAQNLEVEGGIFIDHSGSAHGMDPGVALTVDGQAGKNILLVRDVGANTKLVVNNAGNVGIGIELPANKLEVAGQIKITGGSPAAGKVLTSDAAGLATWQTNAAAGDSDWTVSGTNMYSGVSGNIGIGTNNPQTALHVAGVVTAKSFSGSGAGLTAISGAGLADGSVTSAKIADGAIGSAQLASNAVTSANIAAGQVVKSLNGLRDDVTLAAGPNVTLATNGQTLTIAASGGGTGGVWAQSETNISYIAGKVGIRTNNPQTALHVVGTVTADAFSGSGAGLTGISGAALADGSITSLKIAAGAIGSSQLATGAVTADKMFTREEWGQFLTISNPTPGFYDAFGCSVAAVGTNRVLIGAYGDSQGTSYYAGAAHLFDTAGNLLTTFTNPTPAANDYFGLCVAAVGTTRVLVGALLDNTGATDAGAAYLFDLSGNLLTTFANPTPAASDYFGCSVAAVGTDRVLIGAYWDNTGATDAGAAYLFDLAGNLVTTFTNPAPAASDYFGFPVAAVGTDRVLIGAYGDNTGGTDAGAAYLFDLSGNLLTTFTHTGTSNYFGLSLAAVGTDRVVIGAYGAGVTHAGAAYLFDLAGNLLTTFYNPTPTLDDCFGYSVAAAGSDRVLIGAYRDNTGATDAGAAYLFDLSGNLLTTLTNPSPAASDCFGASVAAVDADKLLIGGYVDDASTGQGVAYLFRAGNYVPGLVADRAITAVNVADGAVTLAKLDSAIGVWTKSGSNISYLDGNVGIGTASPQGQLHVTGSGASSIRTETLSAADAARLDLVAPGGQAQLIFGGANYSWWGGPLSLNFINVADGPLTFGHYFGGSGYERMRITSNGNVGIGTTHPDAALDVAGDVKASGALDVVGDLKVNGAYKGTIGPNGGAPFPRPAYDSGWAPISPGATTLTHNIGGNTDNYVVDMQFKSWNSAIGVNIHHFGGYFDGDQYWGASWFSLTSSSIRIERMTDDGCSDYIRIRIWVYN